ncbi:outer membrane beta-barrel protein [Chitinophaga sp. CF418]|uniref:outer membrane beta-barrel protein n=1 Tax=Chitinophaga sp. CF418 TaxID=1855287 RepID=UPI000921CC71|nr:outer membrane beta-barrel protein [Chitinophaga sp. CF418]SHN42170.1 Outer membrane protein beta-barrel domain-containing protein [Chitinophaga sp. CF418]
MKRKLYLIPLLLCLLQFPAFSQDNKSDTSKHAWKEMIFGRYAGANPSKRPYMTWGGDGPLLSFSDEVRDAGKHVHNIPRFTFFFNVGHNLNYDFDRHFGIFTGLNLKNIGLITKDDRDSVKLKRRVYTLGIPLGFKIGDLRRGSFFFFAGGSYDLAFNYKEKKFIHGDKKDKFNEWFSDRTPLLMPSLFAGLRMSPGFGLKVQYYPKNFFNKEYKEVLNGGTTTPYKDLEAKLFFVTLSYDFGRIPDHKYWKEMHKRHQKHRERNS